MNKAMLTLIVSALLANFTAVSATDDTVLPANPPATAKNDDGSPLKAEEILKKAAEHNPAKSYSSEKTTDADKNIYIDRTYERFNPDGTTFRRMESITKSKKDGRIIHEWTIITNGAGSFEIYGDVAIKDEHRNRDKQGGDISKKEDKEENFTYKVGDIIYKGIPCYKITDTLNDESLKKDDIKVATYVIGRKDYFLHEFTFYSANGKKLSGFELDNVKLDANLDDKLFEVPKECKIFIAKTQDEWLKLSSIAKARNDMRLDENLKKSLEGYYKKYYGTVDMDELLNNVKGDDYGKEHEK